VVTEEGEHPDASPSDDVDGMFAQAKDDPRARGELVERFTPLAAYLARRFSGRGGRSGSRPGSEPGSGEGGRPLRR
jgi:hypothetical protein